MGRSSGLRLRIPSRVRFLTAARAANDSQTFAPLSEWPASIGRAARWPGLALNRSIQLASRIRCKDISARRRGGVIVQDSQQRRHSRVANPVSGLPQPGSDGVARNGTAVPD